MLAIPRNTKIQLEGAVVPPNTFASFAFQNTSDMGLEWLECPVRRPYLHVSNQESESGRVAYLTLLADMSSTLGKIDEKEPTSTSTRNIPGFEVSMNYSNTMKVLYQLIYLGSAGDRVL